MRASANVGIASMSINKKVRNFNNLQSFIQRVGPSAVQQVDVKTPPPEPIEYFYTFEDIFANPKQSSFYKSPYESFEGAQGDFGTRYTDAAVKARASQQAMGNQPLPSSTGPNYVYSGGGAVEYGDMDEIIRILRGK